jgi:hypothetical protein
LKHVCSLIRIQLTQCLSVYFLTNTQSWRPFLYSLHNTTRCWVDLTQRCIQKLSPPTHAKYKRRAHCILIIVSRLAHKISFHGRVWGKSFRLRINLMTELVLSHFPRVYMKCLHSMGTSTDSNSTLQWTFKVVTHLILHGLPTAFVGFYRLVLLFLLCRQEKEVHKWSGTCSVSHW